MIKIEKGIPVPSLSVAKNPQFEELLSEMRKMEIGDSFLWTAQSQTWVRAVAKMLEFKISVWQQRIEKYPDKNDPNCIFTWRVWRTE